MMATPVAITPANSIMVPAFMGMPPPTAAMMKIGAQAIELTKNLEATHLINWIEKSGIWFKAIE